MMYRILNGGAHSSSGRFPGLDPRENGADWEPEGADLLRGNAVAAQHLRGGLVGDAEPVAGRADTRMN
jgi:hypothetical protein